MADIIRKLPDDLKRYITSYTYCPQNKELLADIISYGRTNKLLTQYISDICKGITHGDTHDGKIYHHRFHNLNKLFLKNWKLFKVKERTQKLKVLVELAQNPIPVRVNNPLFVIHVLYDILWTPSTEDIQYYGWARTGSRGPRRSIRNTTSQQQREVTNAEWNSWLRKWCRAPSWPPALRQWKATAFALYPDINWI